MVSECRYLFLPLPPRKKFVSPGKRNGRRNFGPGFSCGPRFWGPRVATCNLNVGAIQFCGKAPARKKILHFFQMTHFCHLFPLLFPFKCLPRFESGPQRNDFDVFMVLAFLLVGLSIAVPISQKSSCWSQQISVLCFYLNCNKQSLRSKSLSFSGLLNCVKASQNNI